MIKKIKIFILLFVICYQLSVVVASAHGVKYFEFSPDTSNAINFSSASALYQYFKPYNDFISAIDIWIDNDGSSGNASFGLRDFNDNLLSSKTEIISKIEKIWGGTRLHIDFNESINVNATGTYKIKTISSLPKLRAYYKSKTELAQHSGNVYVDPRIGSAYLDSDEQNSYFKFALYENNDNLAPLVSNFSLATSSNEVQISFNANEPVDYKAEFISLDLSVQKTINFSNNYRSCPEGLNFCIITADILPDKSYNFSVFIKDEWGNQTQILGLFDSAQVSIFNNNINPTSTATTSETIYVNPETIAPSISNERISYLDPYSVKASWTTDKASRSRLIISIDQAGNQIIADIYDNVYELEHTLNSGAGLIPNTQYFSKIAAFNPLGNFSIKLLEFKTPVETSAIQPQPPQQTIEQPQINNLNVSISENQIISVSWQTPKNEPPNGYRIDIFNGNYKLMDQIISPSDIHSAALSGLAPGNYTIIVYANNNGVFEKIAEPEIIKIPDQSANANANKKTYGIYFIAVLAIIIAGLMILFIFYKKKIPAQ